jgi:hypothetical protein
VTRAELTLRALLTMALLATMVCGCKSEPPPPTKSAGEPRSEVVPPEMDPGRQTIQIFKDYQHEVVELLKAALAGGGTAAAVEVCKGVSVQLSKRFESMPGATVRRVAVKFRNPDHAPDSFETGIFKEWEEQRAAGKVPSAISRETADGFRVMQPIILGSRLCLRCLGTLRALTPDTVEMLKRLYPDDKATGFEMGDIRGAFSATIKPAN